MMIRWGANGLTLLCIGTAVCQPAQLTVAGTAAELQAAVELGADHIVITEHLDLRDVKPQYETNGWPWALNMLVSTLTITGRCMEAPARADLAAEWVEGQCVLEFANQSGLRLGYGRGDIGKRLWIDRLYFLMSEPTADIPKRGAMHFWDDAPSLYLTNVTLEAVPTSKVESDRALISYGSVTASGLKVLNFDTVTDEPLTFSDITGKLPVGAYFVDSILSGNQVSDAVSTRAGAIRGNVPLKFERVTFTNNSGDGAAAEYGVGSWVYQDESGQMFNLVYSDATSVSAYYDFKGERVLIPEPLSAADDYYFRALDDERFLDLHDRVQAALLTAGLGLPSPSSSMPGPTQAPTPGTAQPLGTSESPIKSTEEAPLSGLETGDSQISSTVHLAAIFSAGSASVIASAAAIAAGL